MLHITMHGYIIGIDIPHMVKGGLKLYPNLRAEMARKRIRIKDLAGCIGMSYSATYKKITGVTDFTLDEIVKIRQTLFPEHTIDYLFKKEERPA